MASGYWGLGSLRLAENTGIMGTTHAITLKNIVIHGIYNAVDRKVAFLLSFC
jgi:hypothetical protein